MHGGKRIVAKMNGKLARESFLSPHIPGLKREKTKGSVRANRKESLENFLEIGDSAKEQAYVKGNGVVKTVERRYEEELSARDLKIAVYRQT